MAVKITPPHNPFSKCSTKQECLEQLGKIEDNIRANFVGVQYNPSNMAVFDAELQYWQGFCEHHIPANRLDIEPLHGVDVKVFITGENL